MKAKGSPTPAAKVWGESKGFSEKKGAGVNAGSSSGKQLSKSWESLTGPKPKG